jgi:hypothetical protein
MPPPCLRRLAFNVLLTVAISVPAAASDLWSQLYSPDLAVYAANLRSASVPEAIVGVLISQEVNARFHEREQRLRPSLASVDTLRQEWSAERREAVIQLKREKNDLLRSVLAVVPDETARPIEIPETLSQLTKVQRESVALIMEDYNALNARVITESRGVLIEEDREKIRYLDQARDQDLAKVLGEDNAIDYQISLSRAMKSTEKLLVLFHPTRQELRDIFVIRRKHGFDLVGLNIANPGAMAFLKKAVLADLEKLWGPERFAVFRRTGSPIYQQIYYLVVRLGHPANYADQIYESQFATREGPARRNEELRAQGPHRVVPGEAMPESPPALAKRLIAAHCALVKQLLGEAGYAEYYRLSSKMIDGMEQGRSMRVDDAPY